VSQHRLCLSHPPQPITIDVRDKKLGEAALEKRSILLCPGVSAGHSLSQTGLAALVWLDSKLAIEVAVEKQVKNTEKSNNHDKDKQRLHGPMPFCDEAAKVNGVTRFRCSSWCDLR
jgi:hypothetical protein